MIEVERKILAGQYKSLNMARSVVTRAKIKASEKTRLMALIDAREDGSLGKTPPVEPIASNRVPKNYSYERVAVLMYVIAAKNGVTIEQVFDKVKEITKNWGIDGE